MARKTTKFSSTALAAVAFACFLTLASKDTKDILLNLSMACFALALPLLIVSIAIGESFSETKDPEKAMHIAKYWEAIAAISIAFGLLLIAFSSSIIVGGAFCVGFVISICIMYYLGLLP